MYNLLVVDDEELHCTGLISKIERIGNPLICKIYSANSAIKALQIMQNHKVHIVITDMKMPNMDGIELIRESIEFGMKAKYIILSGFDDFYYAKSALKLGVVDYLLKPVSMTELTENLNNVVNGIKKDQEHLLKLQDQNVINRKVVLENFLNKILSLNKEDEQSVIELFREISAFFTKELFCVSIVELSGWHDNLENRYEMDVIFENWKQKILQNFEVDIFQFIDYNQNNVIIFNVSSQNQMVFIKECLLQLSKDIYDNKNMYLRISNSEIWKDVASILHLYRQARKALLYKIFTPENELLEYYKHEYKNNEMPSIEDQLSEFSENIKLKKLNRAINFIDTIFNNEYLERYSIQIVKNIYQKLIHIIFIHLETDTQLDVKGGLYQKFNTFNSVEEVRIYLKKSVLDSIKTPKYMEGSTIELMVRDFAKKNLNKNIDMAQVANMASMSYYYFSRLFKKQTGKNFVEYLTMMRMEEAVTLLKDPKYKVYQIAALVGYEDSKHFIKVFTKYFGNTPTDYQRKYFNKA